MRTMDAYEYAAGFKGMERMRVDGSDFIDSFHGLSRAFQYCRTERSPILVHASCPLLGHHTSGVRKEWYRGDDLMTQAKNDPIVKLEKYLLQEGFSNQKLDAVG